ncbi:MAG TPA: dihydroorotate dehydrogenase-like protein [Actinomycetes bacterium]|jgi:dihydroorotate dehydrogenase (fumarate)|nr:dihydroorotate dehydrogenase-like protein [Actinomycetes bacterium]
MGVAATDLETVYLGLSLRSPLVASASPLTGNLDDLRRLEAAGVAAVVLPSLFQEQLTGEPPELGPAIGPAEYLRLVERAKDALSVPVIASLNGTAAGSWLEQAYRLEEAGADAVELNVYVVAAHFGLDGHEVELACLDLVRAARQVLGVPLAVKLGPFYSAMANLALRLAEVGADGLVLFNRFYQPDIDVERLQVAPTLILSSSDELRLRLRWIGILYRQLPLSLAATGGVHTGQDVVKALLAGADVAMLASALLRHGPGYLSQVEAELRAWMADHGHESVGQVRGRLSRAGVRDPAAYERANYVSLIASATHRRPSQ